VVTDARPHRRVYPDALTPSVTLGEGDAAIYSLRGNDAALLGHLTPSAWTTLDGPPTAASPTAAAPNGAGELLSSVVSVQARPGQHRGSGFRVAIAGMVVTNAHILRDVPDGAEVFVGLRDGTRRTARLLGRAPNVDIAALKMDDDSGLAPMHSGTGLANARPGDPVLALGGAGNAAPHDR
jgi:S1-C subfamily serine protease